MSEAVPVHIVMVLDESGSMSNLASDLIGGVNQFFADQRVLPGKCRLTLTKFAPFTVIHDAIAIADVPDLTSVTYAPHSMTPLLDAEGGAITSAMARETSRKAAGKKAESVLFVTYTDGLENASREWSFGKLSELKKARTEAGWTFLYMGAGHDAYSQSAEMGTHHMNTTSYEASGAGMRGMTANTSRMATAYRGAANIGDVHTLSSAAVDAYGALAVDPTEGAEPVVGTTTKPPRKASARKVSSKKTP
jgi:hypothetical protein